MKTELRKFNLIDYFRILFRTLDKEYSKEREDTFFSYFLKGLTSVSQKDSYEFAILVDGKFAGNIGFFNPKKGEYELGYFVLKKFRNKGIATKATKKMLDFGFNKLKLKKIWAGTDINNPSSSRVLKKLGFEKIKTDKKKKELIWEKKLK